MSPPPTTGEEEDAALEVELVEVVEEVVEDAVEDGEGVEEPAEVDAGCEVAVSVLDWGGVVL